MNDEPVKRESAKGLKIRRKIIKKLPSANDYIAFSRKNKLIICARKVGLCRFLIIAAIFRRVFNKKSMKKLILGTFAVLIGIFATNAQKDFVKGADVGFLPEQERNGVKFHDRDGKERECLDLLKNDYGLSAIRMRVWVDPKDGVCDKNELLAMGKRAKEMGMDFMVEVFTIMNISVL